MRKMIYGAAIVSLAVCLMAGSSFAADWEKYDEPVPTKVLVRVLSHGAKAMSPQTGAYVVIKDSATNEVLDKGDVQGATGDTKALMDAAYPRKYGMTGLLKGEKGVLTSGGGCEPYESNMDAAVFVGRVNIAKPTQVVVQAQGPMMPHHAGGAAIATTWLFPGEDVLGEGIVLELRGLIVDVLASMKEGEFKVSEIGDSITVPFYMNMMCGCPIALRSMGLPWAAEDYNLTVQAYYKGKLYHEETTSSDKLLVDVSRFKATVPLPKDLPEGKFSKEKLKIRVMAAQPSMANYGIDEFSMYLRD